MCPQWLSFPLHKTRDHIMEIPSILLLGKIIVIENLLEHAPTLHVPILVYLFYDNNFMQILSIMA